MVNRYNNYLSGCFFGNFVIFKIHYTCITINCLKNTETIAILQGRIANSDQSAYKELFTLILQTGYSGWHLLLPGAGNFQKKLSPTFSSVFGGKGKKLKIFETLPSTSRCCGKKYFPQTIFPGSLKTDIVKTLMILEFEPAAPFSNPKRHWNQGNE